MEGGAVEITRKLASEWGLTIDPEFKSLLAEHTQEERALFEDSLLTEGCRDAVAVWGKDDKLIIVDGHHRVAFCEANDIPFAVEVKDFHDRDSAKEWIIKNQLARRNLSIHEKARLALAYKPIIEARARENQGIRTDISQNSVKSIDTQKELAKLADVSHDTISKVEHIEAEAPKPIIEAARKGEMSVNAAYTVAKMNEEKQTEVVKRMAEGMKPKEAIKKAMETKDEEETVDVHELLESTAPYTLDNLIDEIIGNGEDFVNIIRIQISTRAHMFSPDESVPKIAHAIEEIIKEITKIKEELENDAGL